MPTANEISAVEEVSDNERTGVEVETDSDDIINDPWNPDNIRVTSKNFSLRNILDMIDDGSLELAPDFQRQRVWNARQKSRLIESILLRIPLPAFYFSEDDDGSLRVVDGLQRLSAIHEFTQNTADGGGYSLSDLEYLEEVKGKKFSDLSALWVRRLLNTQIFVHVIDPKTPDPVKFNIFKRINTLGTPLNSQEIRHCMSDQRSRDFLKRCVETSEFQKATNGVLKDHKRMTDREVALRFSAFRMLGDVSNYSNHKAMDRFLTDATRRIDSELKDNDLEILLSEFKNSMRNAFKLFGEYAFRKWTIGTDTKRPINRALFEIWSVSLSEFEWRELKPHRDEILQEASDMMLLDQAFIDAISTSTEDPKRVETRFSKIRELLERVTS